jgi:hypothetical protein
MDDMAFDAPRLQPTRQPEAVAAGLVEIDVTSEPEWIDLIANEVASYDRRRRGMAGSWTRSREKISEKTSEERQSHSAVASAFWDCRDRSLVPPSGLTQTLDYMSVVSDRTPGKRPHISLSTCSGAIAIAFSGASFASAIRPSWPSAAASTR